MSNFNTTVKQRTLKIFDIDSLNENISNVKYATSSKSIKSLQPRNTINTLTNQHDYSNKSTMYSKKDFDEGSMNTYFNILNNLKHTESQIKNLTDSMNKLKKTLKEKEKALETKINEYDKISNNNIQLSRIILNKISTYSSSVSFTKEKS